MGLMFRVRLSAFFAGAAAASLAGSYLLYNDYKLAHEAISHQVRDTYQSLEEHYEALDKRIAALEKQKEIETAIPVETSEEGAWCSFSMSSGDICTSSPWKQA